MKKSLYASIISLFFILNFAYTQDLAIFNDYLNRVLIFDNGEIQQAEHLPVRSYQVGNNSIAYEDNTGTFKIYNNGFLHTVTGFVSEYRVTNNLVIYRMNRQLNIFDNGNIVTLGISVTAWDANDDVVIWYDDLEKKLKAYYNKKKYELDDALAAGELSDFQAGKNLIVYTDTRNNVNIFYQGEIFDVFFKDRKKSILAGKDIAAFVEDPMDNFQVFYRGEFIELEPFEPESYQVADGFVAYVDNSNYLKVFSDYSVKTVSFHSPSFYHAKDQLLVYGVQNFFRVFYNNREYTLENYIPDKFIFRNNVVLYLDQHGNLKYFKNGNTKVISYENLTDFELQGSCVRYTFGVRSENIYHNGKTYNND